MRTESSNSNPSRLARAADDNASRRIATRFIATFIASAIGLSILWAIVRPKILMLVIGSTESADQFRGISIVLEIAGIAAILFAAIAVAVLAADKRKDRRA